ncbi:MAG: ABC transporter ATP-binding protein [Anaerolineae bacterium]
MQNSTVLEMRGVRKSFGTVTALDDVNFQLRRNEIHGLLGGNGAGKTTLMNVLYGLYKPDAGQILLHEQPVAIHSPRDAIRHRIGMVHQHFLQIGSYTVLENIVLGTALRRGLTLNLEQEAGRIGDLSARFGLDADPEARIEALPMGSRQKVEILKALYRGAEVLILDEPTTNLIPQEVDSLFQSLRAMVEEGLSVVFITHKLREVLRVCDRISVLRDGRNILTVPRDDASEEVLVRGMVGEELDVSQSILFSAEQPDRAERRLDQRVIVRAEGLQVISPDGLPLLKDCSFEIAGGEIFGIAGVAGNGQQELAESLLGIQPIAGGRATIDGLSVAGATTSALLAAGVAYIPEDRLGDGFLPTANVAQNLILGAHRREPYNRNGLLNWRAIFQAARNLIHEYNIRTPGPEAVAANLSGGNIQRVMIARAFSHPAKFLVAHNPTTGLDIPSMEFVYTKVLEHSRAGGATLLLSEDLDELFLLCDRIGVMYRGRIVGILDRRQFDKYEVGRLMSGAGADG